MTALHALRVREKRRQQGRRVDRISAAMLRADAPLHIGSVGSIAFVLSSKGLHIFHALSL